MIGKMTLQPRQVRLMYCAGVDPHIVSGLEIVLDVDANGLQHLLDVQHKFLRRMLHTSNHSLNAGASSPNCQFFPCVSGVSYSLFVTCNISYDVGVVIRAVNSSAVRGLQSLVNNSKRLYLLHGRLEPLEGQQPRHVTMHHLLYIGGLLLDCCLQNIYYSYAVS